MNTINYPQSDNSKTGIAPATTSNTLSFLSFKRALIANTELRNQIGDIVDLGLMQYVYNRNNTFIDAVRKKAEAETMELMMQFVKGVGNYQALRKVIQRNRIIKALADKDMSEHEELLLRVSGLAPA